MQRKKKIFKKTCGTAFFDGGIRPLPLNTDIASAEQWQRIQIEEDRRLWLVIGGEAYIDPVNHITENKELQYGAPRIT